MSSFAKPAPSPQALLAGIETVAKALGRDCQMDVFAAMLAAPTITQDVKALRDHFAGQALMAIVGNDRLLMDFVKVGEAAGARLGETVAHAAYEFADEMLSARGAA